MKIIRTEQPIVIKGDALKSVNQYYNKYRAILKSTYDLKKAIPKAFPKGNADWIEDVGLHPLRYTFGDIA